MVLQKFILIITVLMSDTRACPKVFAILTETALALITEGPTFSVKTCSLSLKFI